MSVPAADERPPRELGAALLVLPPTLVIGFPVILLETFSDHGRWAEVGLALLRLAVLAGSYLLLLMPLRRSRGWRAPQLPWTVGLAIVACSMLIPVLDQMVLQLLGFWRWVPAGQWLQLFAHGKVELFVLTPALLVSGAALVEHSLSAEREARRLALRAQRMLARYREARLKALRLQLHPHFLFNALNSVAALLMKDRPAALEMMDRLQSLYARSLRSLERSVVPLAEELDWCREYLCVERQRFSDRLRITVQVDPEAAAAAIPPLLLQPLVENAVRHGVARELGAAWIAIEAWMAPTGMLHVRVANSSSVATPLAPGFGLRHTRRRLEEAYGDAALLEVQRTAAVVEARIAVPQQVSALAGAPAA